MGQWHTNPPKELGFVPKLLISTFWYGPKVNVGIESEYIVYKYDLFLELAFLRAECGCKLMNSIFLFQRNVRPVCKRTTHHSGRTWEKIWVNWKWRYEQKYFSLLIFTLKFVMLMYNIIIHSCFLVCNSFI